MTRSAESIAIQQALHGYSDGHRLLACSDTIPAKVLDKLDRTSDLTGYLPDESDFGVYHTGFPCGPFYVFAATWLDHDAPRAGTVLTHSLLIPLELVAAAANPWALSHLHRRPSGAAAASQYKQELLPTAEDGAPALPPDELLVLYFSQSTRPLLRVSTAPPSHYVEQLWALLWPSARQAFRFCTFALQPLSDSGIPYDFLGVPTSAVSAFHRLARSPAWWEGSRELTAPIKHAMAQPWLQQLRGGGTRQLTKHAEEWEQLGIHLAPTQIPIVYRLEELRAGASRRLSAARAQADVLVQLDVEGRSSRWQEALHALIDRQSEAPLDPRPLWELTDLLSRTQLRYWCKQVPSLRQELDSCIRDQLHDRMAQRPQLCAEAIPELCTALQPYLGRAASHRLIVREMGLSSVSEQLVVWVLHAIAKDEQMDASKVVLAVAVMRPLAQNQRISTVVAADFSSQQLRMISQELVDPFLFRKSLGELASSADLSLLWSIRHNAEGVSDDDAVALLGTVDAASIWRWALATKEDDAIVARVAAEASVRLSMTLAAVAVDCVVAMMAVTIFELRAGGEGAVVIKHALRGVPALAAMVLHSASAAVRSAAILTLDDEPLLANLVPASVTRNLFAQAVERVSTLVVSSISSGNLNGEHAMGWLGHDVVGRWLANSAVQQLKPMIRGHSSHVHWSELAQQWQVQHLRPSAGLFRVFQALVADMSVGPLDEMSDVLLWLLESRSPLRDELAVQVAHATRLQSPPRTEELLIASFSTLHRAIKKRSNQTVHFFWPFGIPKEAKEWERWLVRLWQRKRWSRRDLEACAGTSRKLRRRLLERFDD